MGPFGKSEEELKKIAAGLDKRQTALDNREIDLQRQEAVMTHSAEMFKAEKDAFEQERKTFVVFTTQERQKLAQERQDFLSEITSEREKLSHDNAELMRRKEELCQKEAEFKAGYAEQQVAAFRDVIEKRISQLDARQADLDKTQQTLAVQTSELHEKEGLLAKRELDVTEREQKADAGFAEKAYALATESKRQMEANAAEAERLKKAEQNLAEERRKLEEAKEALRQRENEILRAEQIRDAGYSEERGNLDNELNSRQKEVSKAIEEEKQSAAREMQQMRLEAESAITSWKDQKLADFEKEMTALRQQRLSVITEAELAEQDRIRTAIEQERKSWEEEKKKQEASLQEQREELQRFKGKLDVQKSELDGEKERLAGELQRIQNLDGQNRDHHSERMSRLDEEVAERIDERVKSYEARIDEIQTENERLRKSLTIQAGLVSALDEIKKRLGDKDPEEIIRDLNSKTDELRRLKEELATRPTEEMRERYQEMEEQCRSLKLRLEGLEKQRAQDSSELSEVSELKFRNSKLEDENKSLAYRANLYEGAANEAQAELNRLRAAYERPAEVEARYKEIELPYLTKEKGDLSSPPVRNQEGVDELAWLNGIEKACDKYGLHFNPRIINAFHTALKTAEWSPLTVLAGVSGTGKSELPRLYSHFGGLFFNPLSVQPNWDSQESMLGFFNSIDNKFDAQPVLRFLAQSQKEWTEEYPGLKDAICMVLLDEMNLAHPELYFAEFLSKLELRRGMKKDELPTLSVKIGAGLTPYGLPLGRNVLWTGTMNQDETTKSLSDKVLDRSIVIYFPRPTELKRRLKLEALDAKNRGTLLHRNDWFSWMARSTDDPKRAGSNLTEDEIAPYKKYIEEINSYLGVVGRAIGHRVWQSVEYYMANYPNVRVIKSKPRDEQDSRELGKYLHMAFEDQLVQKVMPKLRGIDTRGDSKTKCLDKIRGLIVSGINDNGFNLVEDFDLSCELGYGQFIWQSANYLKEEMGQDDSSSQDDSIADTEEQSVDSLDDAAVHPAFRPNDPGRVKRWYKMTSEQQNAWIENYEKYHE